MLFLPTRPTQGRELSSLSRYINAKSIKPTFQRTREVKRVMRLQFLHLRPIYRKRFVLKTRKIGSKANFCNKINLLERVRRTVIIWNL